MPSIVLVFVNPVQFLGTCFTYNIIKICCHKLKQSRFSLSKMKQKKILKYENERDKSILFLSYGNNLVIYLSKSN